MHCAHRHVPPLIVCTCAAIFYIMKPLNVRRLSNFGVLFALSLGGANLLFYYQVEFAARIYCPEKVWFDYNNVLDHSWIQYSFYAVDVIQFLQA